MVGNAGSLISGIEKLGRLGKLKDGIGIGGITGRLKDGSDGKEGSDGRSGNLKPLLSPEFPGKLGSLRLGNRMVGKLSEGKLGKLKDGIGMGGMTGRLKLGKEGSDGNAGSFGNEKPPPSLPPGKLGSLMDGNWIFGKDREGKLGKEKDGIGMGGIIANRGIGILTSTCFTTFSPYLMMVVITREAITPRSLLRSVG
jgi:hypothetical protein